MLDSLTKHGVLAAQDRRDLKRVRHRGNLFAEITSDYMEHMWRNYCSKGGIYYRLGGIKILARAGTDPEALKSFAFLQMKEPRRAPLPSWQMRKDTLHS